MIAKGFRDAYDIAILVSSAGACLKKAAKSNKQLFDVELHCKVDCEHSPDKK